MLSLVTGGSRGIGLAIAEGLAMHGSDVVIWDVDDERNANAEATLGAQGTRVGAMRIDVTDELSVAQVMHDQIGHAFRFTVKTRTTHDPPGSSCRFRGKAPSSMQGDLGEPACASAPRSQAPTTCAPSSVG